MSDDNQLQRCDDAIGVIETGLATREEFVAAQAFVKKLGEIQRAIRHRWEQAAIAWIEQNGEITEGEIRYYVGSETKVKCVSAPLAWKAILAAVDGDEEKAITAFKSEPFKPSVAKKLLDKQADKHFVSKTEKSLETGKPLKKLKAVNPKFLPGQEEDESDE